MNKNVLLGVVAILILGLVAYIFSSGPSSPSHAAFDPFNATYSIEGQSITLVNGKLEMEAAPGSAAKITTTVFGEPVKGDLNGDGKIDAAVMLTQNSGGSGTFYYVAAAINSDNGAQGTSAVLLGDRIAPQSIEIKDGQIVANYVDRKPGEPMSAAPSIGVSKYLIYDGSMSLKTVM